MVDTAGPQRSAAPVSPPINYQATPRPAMGQSAPTPIPSPISPPKQPLVAPQPALPQQTRASQPLGIEQPAIARTPDPRPMIPQQPATPGPSGDQNPIQAYGSVPAYRQTTEPPFPRQVDNTFGSGHPINPEFGLPASPSNGQHWPPAMTEPPFGAQNEGPVMGDEAAAQWPLMVGEKKTSSGSGLKVLLYLFLAAVLAGVGYFAYVTKIRPALEARTAAKQPVASPPQVQQQQGGKGPAPAATVAASGTAPVKQDSAPASADPKGGNAPKIPADASKAKPDASGVPSAASQSAPPSASENLPAGAKLITLQAASFPNEGAARGFCDKLVAAGIPAYVVAADVPKRGRWYRVRIGKFANADEAKASGSTWHQRAQTARMDLKLIQCDYQKP